MPSPDIADVDLLPINSGLQFSLTQSVAGAQYAIYASSTLIPSQHWQAIGGSIQTGTGMGIDLAITNGLLPLNYYRVGYTLP